MDRNSCAVAFIAWKRIIVEKYVYIYVYIYINTIVAAFYCLLVNTVTSK